MQRTTRESIASESRPERRSGRDRRSVRGALRLAARRRSLRRHKGRRKEDLERGYYTDHHDTWLLATAMGVLLLSVLDSIFTLQLIARGAEELNPLLAWLIEADVNLFAWIKTLMTAVILVFLVSHANYKLFGLMRVRQVLAASLVTYVALVCYQVFLIVSVPPLPDMMLGS